MGPGETDLGAPAGKAHLFGGQWTLVKLETVERYLTAYTTALKNQRFQLLYIDAFAGSGRCEITIEGAPCETAGSASRALAGEPAFDRYLFIEKFAHRCHALRHLAEQFPDRHVDVIGGDANEQLIAALRLVDWRCSRAVVFLDPYGLHLDWRTLELIAATQAIDVWYLFPLSGVVRQAARDPATIDARKAARLTRMLGTDRWRSEWYAPQPTGDLFGLEQEVRSADWTTITTWTTARLRTLFASVLDPKILRLPSDNGRGTPLYALFFAVANPLPAARDVANRIARHLIRDN